MKSETIKQLIGSRIREVRQQRGVSLQELGKALGISYQQTQKYECGVNRIGAEQLLLAAQFLQVPATWLLGESMRGDPALVQQIEDLHQEIGQVLKEWKLSVTVASPSHNWDWW